MARTQHSPCELCSPSSCRDNGTAPYPWPCLQNCSRLAYSPKPFRALGTSSISEQWHVSGSSPASPLFSSLLPRKRHQQVISDLMQREEKRQVQASIMIMITAMYVEKRSPSKGQSMFSRSVVAFLILKCCFSDLVEKRAGECATAFKWREINEVIFQGVEGVFIISPREHPARCFIPCASRKAL